ncbi:hypothetical protein POM88_045281 [Heracleum sosnowskyi]|uniref:Reverse transcriptase domain-containing protein n=1 Tax=Heracleum sosnowskyi TaxID=360622 RepID=A0AAD8H747_9APIA|nr:hypothetical protein POM88_045281 [Heracleum sosnowskyi]
MGKGIGRPRKKAKKFKNPFDLGLGKCKKVNIKGNIVAPKRKTSLPTIPESDLIRPQDEADLIIETTQLMGLSFPLGIERGKQEIAKKLEQGWLQEDSLKALLKVFWDNNKVESGNLQSVLKKAKEIIIDWSKNFTSDYEKKVKGLEDFLEVEEQKENSSSSFFRLRKDLDNLYILRDDILRQKSRLKWSLKGDRNTRFFHQTIRRRNHSNNIKKLWWNEEWLSSPNLIKNAFLDYFSKFLSAKDQRRIFAMGNLLTVKLSYEDNCWLEKDFSLEEIEWALKQMSNEKAPGPDSFKIGYIKEFWPHIKDKVLECFRGFGNGVPLPRSFNSSFITLIPKGVSMTNSEEQITHLQFADDTILFLEGVYKKLEKIRWTSFWGSETFNGKVSKKMHLISWKKISLRKEYGGLGISSIQSRNKALLSKWISRWYSERSSKWNQWICAKYHCHIGDSIEEVFPGDCVSLALSGALFSWSKPLLVISGVHKGSSCGHNFFI